MSRKKLLYSILIIFLSTLTAGVIYINSLLPIITGYAAKNLASAVFISGRDQQSVEKLDLNFSLIRFTSNEVDTVNKKVISSFLWAESTAIYREGFGCTIIRDVYEKALRDVHFPEGTEATYDQEIENWPLGNVLHPGHDSIINLTKLDKIADELVDKDAYNGNAFAFIAMHKGVIISEKYKPSFTRKTRFLSWSMAKSFTNALVGILALENNWDIHKPLDIAEWQSDERKNITINDLLCMQSGLDWNENYGNRSDITLMLHCESDMASYVINQPIKSLPGKEWYYSSGSTVIITSQIKKLLNNDRAYYGFTKERLFNRIGMPDAVFEVDVSGTLVGSSYIYATARDYARFALLYIQDGIFNDERILPKGWVKYSTTPVTDSDGAYGSSFWLNRNKEFSEAPASMYYCKGHDGQRIFIFPEQDLALVILGYSPAPDQAMDFNSLIRDVLSAFAN